MCRVPTDHPPALTPDAALFLDIDGTLADFAVDPREVRIDAQVMAELPRIGEILCGAVAFVTGRTIADADRLFPGMKLPIAGQHGCERRDARGRIERHWPPQALLADLRVRLNAITAGYAGLRLEDKGATFAVHYRGMPALAGYVHRAVKSALSTVPAGMLFVIQPGNRVVELRPAACNKGGAIRAFMSEAPFAGRVPVFIGDDRSDEEGFAVVDALGGSSISVGATRSVASFRLPDVVAVRSWLLGLAPSALGACAPAT